jgi:hypothetical protein
MGCGSLRAQLYGDFVAPALSGSTSTDGWFNLNSTNYSGYGSFPGLTNWPAPIAANQSGSGDATFDKVDGTSGYLASATTNAIYSPDETNLGTFSVLDATALGSVSNILLQVGSTGNLGGTALTLNYNGGTQNLAPGYAMLISSNAVSTPFGPATYYVWGYQWDVTGLGVTSFDATWTVAAAHDLTYGARLDQSSTFMQVVPEPSSALLAIAGVGLAWLRRSRGAAR